MINGKLYLAGSAKSLAAELHISENGFQLYAEDHFSMTGKFDELEISDRLGNIARKITLKDGSVFETKANDEIDQSLKKQTKSTGLMVFIHQLEKNLSLVVLSVFIIAGLFFSGIKWGLPAVSNIIAEALPDSANQALSSYALQFLDSSILEPSQLPKSTQEKILQHFKEDIAPLYQANNATSFSLHFRRWPLNGKDSIANALALPNGNIIITDRFVELVQNDNEMDIVLLHEMGHIVDRHALKKVIAGSIMTVISSLILGDASSVADFGVGIGSFLVSNTYSRHYETQADRFAYEHAIKAGIPPFSLGAILTTMEQDSIGKVERRDSNPTSKIEETKADNNLSDFISSHPSSKKRIIMGEHYQACFDNGITSCPPPEN
ncbi:M48 family metallopeptidase [Marinomonas rhizomae]|uniref:M48 family metallopeptidase n=1 Tax=Marinomonas rhizomae TaxID=491948 RepID=UPI0021052E55|nr:M48 family metallopeptidase [Marinomonas rhizomae]UTW00460.1 M48 family metallopeptidase [Marinomonas rhizomae]